MKRVIKEYCVKRKWKEGLKIMKGINDKNLSIGLACRSIWLLGVFISPIMMPDKFSFYCWKSLAPQTGLNRLSSASQYLGHLSEWLSNERGALNNHGSCDHALFESLSFMIGQSDIMLHAKKACQQRKLVICDITLAFTCTWPWLGQPVLSSSGPEWVCAPK